MTVQVPSAGADGARVRRSTAAQRAYERRQHRASVVTGDTTSPVVSVTSAAYSSKVIVARIPFVATIIGLLCLGLAATLLLTTRSAEDSYQLSAARSHNQTLREQKAAYQRQVAAGSSAPILAAEAAKLGLIPAKDPARLVMSTDGSVQVVGTPKPAEGKPVPPLDRTPAPTPAPTAARPPAGSRPAAPVPATPNSSPQTPAPAPTTPQPVNDGRIQAREGQLTPVTVITQPSPGGRQ